MLIAIVMMTGFVMMVMVVEVGVAILLLVTTFLRGAEGRGDHLKG